MSMAVKGLLVVGLLFGTACEAKSDKKTEDKKCYVEGYTKSDGRKVDGYYRSC